MEIVKQRSNICGEFIVFKSDIDYSIQYNPSELFIKRNIPSKVITKALDTDLDKYLDELKINLVSIFNELSPMANYRVYGKHRIQKTFRAMDLRKGVQTGNLIYASLITKKHGDKAVEELNRDNPEWQFELRHV